MSLLLSSAPAMKMGRISSVVTPVVARRNASMAIFAKKANPASPISNWQLTKSNTMDFTQSVVHIGPAIHLVKKLGFRPTPPELGLLCLLFVLSTAIGSFIAMAMISIPTMRGFGRLASSMGKLSDVVTEEVPGTISSLKLSGLEINELTQQLSNLRQKIYGSQYGKNERRKK